VTLEKMEGFSFVPPVTGLNRPNTGKEDYIYVCVCVCVRACVRAC
jgi:hypothetical protein